MSYTLFLQFFVSYIEVVARGFLSGRKGGFLKIYLKKFPKSSLRNWFDTNCKKRETKSAHNLHMYIFLLSMDHIYICMKNNNKNIISTPIDAIRYAIRTISQRG